MRNSIDPKNLQNTLESQHILLQTGKKMEKSELSKPQEGIGDTSSRNKICQKMKRKNTFMQESHLPSNRVTYRDRLLHYKKPIHPLTLSKTLDQESILKEKDSCPFWIKSLEETYQKLWLPIKTDFQDSGMRCLSSCSTALESPSQLFQIQMSKNLQQNWQTTSCQSLQFSQPDTMDNDPIKFCRKIRFYPTEEQSKLLNKCAGASRYFYNKAIGFLKNCDPDIENSVNLKISVDKKPLTLKTRMTVFKKPKDGKLISFKISIKHDPEENPLKVYISQDYPKVAKYLHLSVLRPLVMKSDKDLSDDELWQKDIPYDTRQEAISDAISAYKGCLTKLRQRQIRHFKIQYRSKKNMQTETFRVNQNAINPEEFSFFQKRLKKKKRFRIKKRDVSKFNEYGTLDGNFLISKTKPGKWYFCFPRTREKPVYEEAVYKSVFLDPGVRTFQTFYSPDGIAGKIGLPNFEKELKALATKHDLLWSKSDQKQIKKKTKYNLRNRCSRIRNKIKNKVDNLHWQTCSMLCKTFENIFTTTFAVSEMVQGSPLGSNITRKMLQLSHGKFKERLLYYAKTKNRNVYILEEQFTTKTCGNCGNIQTIDALKTYDCSNCKIKLDRDYNASRNICLKFLSKFI